MKSTGLPYIIVKNFKIRVLFGVVVWMNGYGGGAVLILHNGGKHLNPALVICPINLQFLAELYLSVDFLVSNISLFVNLLIAVRLTLSKKEKTLIKLSTHFFLHSCSNYMMNVTWFDVCFVQKPYWHSYFLIKISLYRFDLIKFMID